MLPPMMLSLLVLILALYDPGRTCETDYNPLTLEPPEVIGEYKGNVTVNCSSTEEFHNGMYWTNGATKSKLEEDEAFTTWEVSLSDWNVTAECRIKTDSGECKKELEITIYKNPDQVLVYPLKHRLGAVEGMEYELQCDILEVAPVQNLTVRWYKNNETMETVSFTNTTKTPVSESSVLKVNLSRKDDGVQFRCEAQLDFGPYGPILPVVFDARTVYVHYAPEVNSTNEDIIVEEGHDVNLLCEAEGNPHPHFHWTLDGVNMTESVNNLSIIHVNDNTTYTCTATNYVGGITKHFHVHVKENAPAPAAAVPTPEPPPKRDCSLTLTPAEIVVRFGDPASINCSTSDEGAAVMGWEAAFGGTGVQVPPSVTWTVEKLEHWGIMPKCFVTLKDDTQCTLKPSITLYKTPDDVSISDLGQGPMVEGKNYTLKCAITSVAPVNLVVKWYLGNKTEKTKTFKDTRTKATPRNMTAVLNVTSKREHNGALFRCSVEQHLGPRGPQPVPTTTSEPYTAVVYYKPLVRHCPASYAGKEHHFSMDMFPCEVDANPRPTLHWYHEGKPINASEPLTRDHSGKYTAKIVNNLGMDETSVNITIEYAPEFTCNVRYEVEESSELQTTCEQSGIPTPNITWFKNGEDVAFPRRWTKHDSGTYVLKATNKHGTASHMLYLDVLYAPVFKEGNYSKQMTPGENVTFDCHAEGNPAPEIRWKYTSAVNVRETTGWRQKNISVTGATSTNAGVYICVATNKVGSVSRSVTLMMKGAKTGSFSPTILWIIIIIIVSVVLITFLVLLRKHWKKHGQYSFIPDKANNSSHIPMTTKSSG